MFSFYTYMYMCITKKLLHKSRKALEVAMSCRNYKNFAYLISMLYPRMLQKSDKSLKSKKKAVWRKHAALQGWKWNEVHKNLIT